MQKRVYDNPTRKYIIARHMKLISYSIDAEWTRVNHMLKSLMT